MNDASSWYVKRGERSLGPISSAKLKVLIENGTVTADSLIKNQAEAPWEKATEFDLPVNNITIPMDANEISLPPPATRISDGNAEQNTMHPKKGMAQEKPATKKRVDLQDLLPVWLRKPSRVDIAFIASFTITSLATGFFFGSQYENARIRKAMLNAFSNLSKLDAPNQLGSDAIPTSDKIAHQSEQIELDSKGELSTGDAKATDGMPTTIDVEKANARLTNPPTDTIERTGKSNVAMNSEQQAKSGLASSNSRKRWKNRTYQSEIVRISPKEWLEIADGSMKTLWHYETRRETDDYIELFMIERQHLIRIYSDHADISLGDEAHFKFVAGGEWIP